MKEIIINKNEDSSSLIALFENGKLVEKYDEMQDTKAFEGNIYCGIVKDILPGMQSAFIDIGDKRNTFIRLKDLLPKEDETKTDMVLDESSMVVTVTKKEGSPTTTTYTISGVADGKFTATSGDGTIEYTFNYDPGANLLHLYNTFPCKIY